MAELHGRVTLVKRHMLGVFLTALFGSLLPGFGAQQRINPQNTAIRYTGRVDKSDRLVVRFDWPGVMLEALFEGTSCAIEMSGSKERFNVFIDGKFVRIVKTDSRQKKIELVNDLPDTLHHLQLTKRYEAEGVIPAVTALFIDKGKRLRPLPPRPRYRIEFIGASSLNGFGNEAGSVFCTEIPDSSNCFYSYGPVAARMLSAECFVLATTGRGIVRNWGSPFISKANTYPVYYDRTLWNSEQSPRWNYHAWQPHVVVVSLGINDFSTNPQPTKPLFLARYFAFVRSIYARYPGVAVVCLTSSKEPLRSYVREFVEREISEGNRRIRVVSYDEIPYWERGCDWHPNVKAHRKIAEMLVTVIKPLLAEKKEY